MKVPGSSTVNNFFGRAEDDFVGDVIIIGIALGAVYWLYTQLMNEANSEISSLEAPFIAAGQAIEAPFVAAGDWITQQGEGSTPDDSSTVQVDSGYASGA